jgi:hypothetical protein
MRCVQKSKSDRREFRPAVVTELHPSQAPPIKGIEQERPEVKAVSVKNVREQERLG